MNHPSQADLEQEALEALEDFRQGLADAEQLKLLAWLTMIDDRTLGRIQSRAGSDQ